MPHQRGGTVGEAQEEQDGAEQWNEIALFCDVLCR